MPVQTRIRIEGYRELQRAISRAVDRDLPKRIGQVHKQVGQLVVSKLPIRAVGSGAGATVRPSATRREVILRAGGNWRDIRPRQWGRVQEWPGGEAPPRPSIIGTARANQAEIERMLFDGIGQALKPPFD